MVQALIKITQGATTDIPGRAVKGAAGINVVFSNGDDTGVNSWKYELLYTPPESLLVPFTQGPGIVDDFSIGIPDVPGCYRVRLTVADANGNEDVDIRNFAVPGPVLGLIIPPFQGDPLPLPQSGVGSKPNEMNFAGQPNGWDGIHDVNHLLMYEAMKRFDLLGEKQFPRFPTSDATANQVIATFDTSLITGDYNIEAICTWIARRSDGVDDALYARRAYFKRLAGVLSQVDITQILFADIETGTLAPASVSLVASGDLIQMRATGVAAINIDWFPYMKLKFSLSP